VKTAEEAIEEARKALAEGGLDRLNAAAESLTKASHHIAETMYKAQQASGAAAGAPGGADGASGGGAHGGNTSGQGDVVDAEFVDVDDSKKPN
jgi:molecular chaperone DnaK